MKKHILCYSLLSSLLLFACSDSTNNENKQIQEQNEINEIVERLSLSSNETIVQELESHDKVEKADIMILDGLKKVLVTVYVTENIPKEQADQLAETQLEKIKSEYENHSILITITRNEEQLSQKVFEID